MRPAAWAIAISAAVHAAAAGVWLETREHPKAVKHVAAPALTPEPVPIDIVLLDIPRDTTTVSHATPQGELRVATGTHPAVREQPAPPQPARQPSHSPLMTMRSPEVDL